MTDPCKDYFDFLFSAGYWAIIGGILLGFALAIVSLILALRKNPQLTTAAGATPATPLAILEAIRGFLQALSAAPTWLALVGVGVLLLWMAGNNVAERCPLATSSHSAQDPAHKQ